MHEIMKQITMRSKNYHEADFLDNVLGSWRDAVMEKSVPVVLYGAGSAGKDILPVFQLHGVFPKCFCDSNPRLAHTMYFGLPVISRDELKQDKESIIFVTSVKFGEQIKRELVEDGMEESRIINIKPAILSFYSQFFQLHATLGDLNANQDKIEAVYHWLSDQRSRDVYLNKTALFAYGADYSSYTRFLDEYFEQHSEECAGFPTNPEHFENYYYCNNPFYAVRPHETVINGGAFEGGFALTFIAYCNEKGLPYSHLYSFEPDQKNFQQLEKHTDGIRNVTNFCLGLWTHKTEIRFLSSDKIEGSSARVVRESGDIEVIDPRSGDMVINTVSLDEFLPDVEISFIKLDVEGAEIEAILGAKKIIQTYHPKLAISVYHKTNDLFEIPYLIHTICPSYKMYIRHLNDSFMGTVLFAVPE